MIPLFFLKFSPHRFMILSRMAFFLCVRFSIGSGSSSLASLSTTNSSSFERADTVA